MPELPELEVVRDVLTRRIRGQTIVSSDVIPPGGPIVVRDLTGAGFAQGLAGARIERVMRRGKVLVFRLSGTNGPLWLVVNPKLTGRLQLCEPKAKKAGPVHLVLHLSGRQDMRYVDQMKMGQLLVTRQPQEEVEISREDSGRG